MEYSFESIINNLRKSKFRSSFHLSDSDIKTINEKGISKIREHAFSLLKNRIKIKSENDGRQTPWKGHPVFVAQHALALCCRKCMEKWYNLSPDRVLSDNEIDYFSDLATEWIKKEFNNKL